MESPLVSLIVPAYNAAAYLRECADSILAQTYANLEAIIVDDGSTDSTPHIADEYAKNYSQVKVIHTLNGGPSSARNTGIDRAKGEYIGFVDADDAIHPMFVEIAIHELQHTNADIFSCGFCRKAPFHAINISGPSKSMSPKAAIEDVLYQRQNMLCSVWTHLFKSEIVKTERFTPDIWYEDLDFFYRVYERASLITHTDSRLYFYRINPAGILHTFNDRRLSVLDVTDDIVNHYRDDQRLLMAAIDRRFAAYFNMFVLCSRHNHPARQRCWETISSTKFKILFNSRSRLKNRIGALVACLGQRTAMAIASLFYRTS